MLPVFFLPPIVGQAAEGSMTRQRPVVILVPATPLSRLLMPLSTLTRNTNMIRKGELRHTAGTLPATSLAM